MMLNHKTYSSNLDIVCKFFFFFLDKGSFPTNWADFVRPVFGRYWFVDSAMLKDSTFSLAVLLDFTTLKAASRCPSTEIPLILFLTNVLSISKMWVNEKHVSYVRRSVSSCLLTAEGKIVSDQRLFKFTSNAEHIADMNNVAQNCDVHCYPKRSAGYCPKAL